MSRQGYERLAQTEPGPSSPPSSPGPSRKEPLHIDLGKLDNAFKKWTEAISKRVHRKKPKTQNYKKLQIWRSVFEPAVEPCEPVYEHKTLDHEPAMSTERFSSIIMSIKEAILDGIHPRLIIKGSSGSYFARAKNETGKVTTVAVFKPKDEEPYGRLNPKTTKWLHRQLRFIIPFGRACLIPNLSYISEAAASLLDARLELSIVPPTELVSLASPAFFYDWIDRTASKNGKPLPEKVGSLQYFMHGFTDASDFLRKHPLPGRSIHDTFDDTNHRQGSILKRVLNTLKIVCGKTGEEEVYEDSDYEEDRLFDATETHETTSEFHWTSALQDSFREELEKLVILDYLMRNTDRGADNYMIKFCEADHDKHLIDVAPSRTAKLEMPAMTVPTMTASPSGNVNRTSEKGDYTHTPHIHIAAIDNSLSFPHEHPKGWRSYTFGWLFLPVSVIGRPFSQETRNHFLPKLTSKEWWEETTYQLEKLFAVDPDFHPKMFRRQMAVMKGQAYNIVQSLKHADEGPLELTRRGKALVWDDELEIASEAIDDPFNDPLSSPRSIQIPLGRTRRSPSSGDFPPPMRRTSTDAGGRPRPVPFANKFQRIHPGTTGVTILEHLERLDAVEASLQRFATDEDLMEVDVGESSSSHKAKGKNIMRTTSGLESPPLSPGTLPTLREHEEMSDSSSVEEEDLVALSKSLPHVDPGGGHSRFASQNQGAFDWISRSGEGGKRTVIVERLETVEEKRMCTCW